MKRHDTLSHQPGIWQPAAQRRVSTEARREPPEHTPWIVPDTTLLLHAVLANEACSPGNKHAR